MNYIDIDQPIKWQKITRRDESDVIERYTCKVVKTRLLSKALVCVGIKSNEIGIFDL